MGSSVFNQFGKRPQNNPMQMMRQFMDFKNNFNGDPKAKVQELLNSGQMTQDQYNQLSGMANQFKSMMTMFK